MVNTTVHGGVAPAPKSLAARFIGIITSPRATYEAVVPHPKWFGMLALCVAVMAVLVGGFMLSPVGRDAWLDAALNGPMAPRDMNEQQLQAMERMAPLMGYFTIGWMLIGLPLVMALVAAILYAIFNAAMGGTATFKQVYTVLVHVGPIAVLSTLFTVPLNYTRGTMSSSTNLGVLFQFIDESSFLGRLLGTIDLFLVWQLMVLSIGLAVLYKRRTQPIATALFALYAVIALVIAFVRRGGA